MQTLFFLFIVFGLVGSSGCATKSYSKVSSEIDEPMIVVQSVRIPKSQPWYSRFAQHSWIDVYQDREWKRIELLSPIHNIEVTTINNEPAEIKSERWGNKVRIHALYAGRKYSDLSQQIIDQALEWNKKQEFPASYRAIPGPNSNTIIETILRDNGIAAELWPNALGRDYESSIRIATTPDHSSFEVETAFLGVQIGRTTELHIVQFPIGVTFWPPAINLPFLPPVGFWDASVKIENP